MEAFKKHFSREELRSILQTFISVAAVDAAMEMEVILAGDFSKAALAALAVALLRSVLKALWAWAGSKK